MQVLDLMKTLTLSILEGGLRENNSMSNATHNNPQLPLASLHQLAHSMMLPLLSIWVSVVPSRLLKVENHSKVCKMVLWNLTSSLLPKPIDLVLKVQIPYQTQQHWLVTLTICSLQQEISS